MRRHLIMIFLATTAMFLTSCSSSDKKSGKQSEQEAEQTLALDESPIYTELTKVPLPCSNMRGRRLESSMQHRRNRSITSNTHPLSSSLPTWMATAILRSCCVARRLTQPSTPLSRGRFTSSHLWIALRWGSPSRRKVSSCEMA